MSSSLLSAYKGLKLTKAVPSGSGIWACLLSAYKGLKHSSLIAQREHERTFIKCL